MSKVAEAAIDKAESAYIKTTHPSHQGATREQQIVESSEHKHYKYITLSNDGASQLKHVPYGSITGYSPSGVPAYSNGSDAHFSNQKAMWTKNSNDQTDTNNQFCTGFEWQCVEYGRRWLLQHRGILLPDVQIAAHIIYLNRMLHVPTMTSIMVQPVFNGTFTPPTAGSLIIYPQSTENFVGHVGVITEATETYVRVADQNRFFHNWGSEPYSAEYKVEKDEIGQYWIRDDVIAPIGWVTFPIKPADKADNPQATSTTSTNTSFLYADVYPPQTTEEEFTWLHRLSISPELGGGVNLGGWTYLGYWGRSMGSFKGKLIFGATLTRILVYVSWRSVSEKIWGKKAADGSD